MPRKGKKRRQRSEQQAAAPPPPAGAPLSSPDSVPSPLDASLDSSSAAASAPAPTAGPPNAARADDGPIALEADESDPVAENLDADIDVDDEAISYESLVAAVAEMESPERDPPPAMPAESEEVHDLDDDDGAVGSVDRLIAQVGRGAPAAARPDEPVEDVPIIDLDDDVPAPPPRRGSSVAAPAATHAGPDLSRLARAAAGGAIDVSEPPAVRLDLFGDVSTPEARARLLAAALADAEHKEARYRVPLAEPRRPALWKGVGASVVLVLAGMLALAPPAWVRPEPPAMLSDAARERGLRIALLLQAQQVEAYRVRTHELPGSLDDLPVTLDGLRYVTSGRSYQLVAFTPAGNPIVYDAADPSPAFRVLQGMLAAVEEAP